MIRVNIMGIPACAAWLTPTGSEVHRNVNIMVQ